ncbi:MAG: YvcK family protein [Acidobacteriota bacterium]|nr:YvcK family protein [Blastocatellia bacterium]MDW8411776.1 YvcK family protein [Acidobacteriota bacterium]
MSKIVSIGGGTGLSTLLSGIKRYVEPAEIVTDLTVSSLTAIVTVTDDGGSSGRIREEFNILPPGDIRNCLVALSEDEKLLAKLFQYRFAGNGGLNGHSFGNLFLTALTGVTGDFLEAIKLSSEVLAVRGRIFPSTMTDVTLHAELTNGQIVHGESNITASQVGISKVWLSPKRCLPLQEALDAIREADLITLGPGSLYTSVIPNLLVEGIAKAIAESAATKVYVANIMTQPGETIGYDLTKHLAAIFDAAPELTIDIVVVNNRPISEAQQKLYAADGAYQIGLQEANHGLLQVNSRSIRLVADDLLDCCDKVRHSPQKLAQLLIKILAERGIKI